MNEALVLTFIRQRFTSPIRVALLFLAFAFPILLVAAAPSLRFGPLESSLYFVLIVGAGMVGQDVSSGVLQLLFARPVRRSEYAISRWIAVSASAAGIALVQVLVAALVLSSRGAPPRAVEAAMVAGSHVTSALGAAAVLLLLSTLAPGVADLALLLALNMVAGVAQVIGGAARLEWLTPPARLLQEILSPALDVTALLGPTIPWHAIVSYLSSVTLCLALAIVVLNRKELSYASG